MTRIVGIDCAVDPRKVGLAVGDVDRRGRCSVREATLGEPGRLAAQVSAWWPPADTRVLLALDAPLGWPAALAETLAGHAAGEPVAAAPDALFRRLTDREIRRRLGKQPLEVGADRIARTAVAALQLLAELERPVTLAAGPDFSGAAACEVYPAGTLTAFGLVATGYKKPEQTAVRERILAGLPAGFAVAPAARRAALATADALDAVLCVLAGWDLVQGRAVAPAPGQRDLARREGWIWVRERD